MRTKTNAAKSSWPLQQARYEVGRVRRQYDAVYPDNRLGELQPPITPNIQ